MTTSGTLKSLARIGYVRSIADQYEEQTPDVSDTLKRLLEGLRSHCDAAMQCWQERLNHGDLRRIGAMLSALGQNTPLNKPRDISCYTAFGLCLLEDMTPMLKSRKKMAVDRVKISLLDVHNHFCDKEESYQCLEEAAKGADFWQVAMIGNE